MAVTAGPSIGWLRPVGQRSYAYMELPVPQAAVCRQFNETRQLISPTEINAAPQQDREANA
jgi:hypothetical protein